MNWQTFFREVAKRGYTVEISPAYFFDATSGVRVSVAGFTPDDDDDEDDAEDVVDAPTYITVVRHGAIADESDDKILAAAIEMFNAVAEAEGQPTI